MKVEGKNILRKIWRNKRTRIYLLIPVLFIACAVPALINAYVLGGADEENAVVDDTYVSEQKEDEPQEVAVQEENPNVVDPISSNEEPVVEDEQVDLDPATGEYDVESEEEDKGFFSNLKDKFVAWEEKVEQENKEKDEAMGRVERTITGDDVAKFMENNPNFISTLGLKRLLECERLPKGLSDDYLWEYFEYVDREFSDTFQKAYEDLPEGLSLNEKEVDKFIKKTYKIKKAADRSDKIESLDEESSLYTKDVKKYIRARYAMYTVKKEITKRGL
jgi:hypothetical protein